jgi:hypothetical protein
MISDAILNGDTVAPATLDVVIGQMTSGTLTLPAGTIVGTATIKVAGTIAGAGMAQTVIDATNISTGISQGKGILVPNVPGIVIRDMTLKGAATTDLNGAGIRDGQDNTGFTALRVRFTGCQMGALYNASNAAFVDCVWDGNGAGTDTNQVFDTHDIYASAGGPTDTVTQTVTLTVTNPSIAQSAGSTHGVKSRHGTTFINGGTINGNPDTNVDGVGGSLIDLPWGGNATINGTTLIQNGGGGNNLFIGYAMETANNAPVGKTLKLENVHLTDKTGTGGIIQNGMFIPDAILNIGTGCVYDGTIAPQIKNFASVIGAFQPSGH